METLIKPLLDILQELYIGVNNNAPTWVIDSNPGEGFTATLKTITAKQASMPLVHGGSTVAAHEEHLRWSINYALEFYKGNTPPTNWEESWKLRKVDEEEWSKLQQDLLEAYSQLKEALEKVQDWSNPALIKGTLALLPHAAYHLGSIKQMIIAVKDLED